MRGNAGVCRCIIQSRRFDDQLLDTILQTLKDEKDEEEDEGKAAELKRKKMRTTNAHRQGKHLATLVAEDWEAWWKLSSYEKHLYWKYEDGTLLEERNDIAKAFGHGLVCNDREEIIAQLAMDKCFAYRAIEDFCGSTLKPNA